MGLFKKIDNGLDNANLKAIVSELPNFGYYSPVSVLPSDYTKDARLMARTHLMGPFHVDLASIGEKYFCFIALGDGREWDEVSRRNGFELNISTAWSRHSTVAKAYINTIEQVREMANEYLRLETQGEDFGVSETRRVEDIEPTQTEEFEWEKYAEGQPTHQYSSEIDTEGELLSFEEAVEVVNEGLSDFLEETFSLSNFKNLVTWTQEILIEREIDIKLKVGNKDLDPLFPEQALKAKVKGLEDSIFFADGAHWAFYDPSRKGKPYKTTQIGLLEGPEMFALYVSYFYLLKALALLTTEDGFKLAQKHNLSLGLMEPILDFLREIKSEDNDTTSLAASAYLASWHELATKLM